MLTVDHKPSADNPFGEIVSIHLTFIKPRLWLAIERLLRRRGLIA